MARLFRSGYYISTFGGLGGSEQKCLFCLCGLGGGIYRKNANVIYMNSYPPGNGFEVCKISLNSLVTAYI